MSYCVRDMVFARDFGTGARKLLAIYLAGFASDDGTGIWPSKAKMAKFGCCEVRSIQRLINEFLAEGLLIQTGRRRCQNGYIVEYAMNLEVLERLPSIHADNDDDDGQATGADNDATNRADFDRRQIVTRQEKAAKWRFDTRKKRWRHMTFTTPTGDKLSPKPLIESINKPYAGARREPPPAQDRWKSADKKTAGGRQSQASNAQTAQRDIGPDRNRHPQDWCAWANARLERQDVSWIVGPDGVPVMAVNPERRAA